MADPARCRSNHSESGVFRSVQPALNYEVDLLLSMTGFGEARFQDPRWTILVEVRTVNNRHFKLSAKISDAYATMEPALEQLVREKVKCGNVQLNVKIDRPRRPEDFRLNLVALASYRDQLKGFQGSDQRTIDVSQLLILPGVVEQVTSESRVADQDWPAIAEVVVKALADLESSPSRGSGDGGRTDRVRRGRGRSVEPNR